MPVAVLLRPVLQRAAAARASFDRERAGRAERRRVRAKGRAIAASRGETDHLVALAELCDRSYEADRADAESVDLWALPLVTIRGVATRAVLRHRIARGHCRLGSRYEALGREAVAGEGGADPLAPVAGKPEAERRTVRREATRFGRAFWGQLRPALLPKAPALTGLAVGWWIANTYTDSRWKSLARSVGIGSGGTTVVSADTYRAMRFWLPLLAAAVCAYLADRIAAALRGSES
jgi:hypothetical protein